MKSIRFIILSLTILLTSSCSRESPKVVFGIPKNFKGVFVISEGKGSGTEGKYENGEYQINIPDSGSAVVKDFAILTKWHKEYATFADGTTITVDFERPNEMDLRVYNLGSILGHGIYYLVGTRKDYLAAMSQGDFTKLPLGKVIIEAQTPTNAQAVPPK